MAFSDWFLPKGAQTTDEAEENFNRQQEALRAQQRRRLDEQSISANTVEINNRLLSTHLDDQDAAARMGFVEGLAEGRDNIKNAVNSAVTGGVGGVLKAIPASVYVIAAIALFFYLGGAAWLLGRGKGLMR